MRIYIYIYIYIYRYIYNACFSVGLYLFYVFVVWLLSLVWFFFGVGGWVRMFVVGLVGKGNNLVIH